MDAPQLARWTRFAAKGGIGKCTAVTDYVAQSSEDLMFLKGDEIVVLMRIPDSEDGYLGFCEDIIGRFRGKDVQFHGKLKRPIMTKRSSVSATRQSPSRSNSVSTEDHRHPPSSSLPSTDDEALYPPSASISVSTTPSDTTVATPPNAKGPPLLPSLASPPLHSPRIVLADFPPPSPLVISPLNIIKKSPTSSPLHQTSFAHEESQTTHTSIPPSIPTSSPAASLQPSLNDPDSDGEVGIGLSLLQSLGQDDSDDESLGLHASIQHDDENLVEGLLYAEPHESDPYLPDPQPPPLNPRVNSNQRDPTFRDVPPQSVAFPSRSSSPLSPTSPRSFASLSPPSNQQHFSISSRRPSVQSSSSWEGAGDIYDDYRYSRASMFSGATNRARLSSVGSRVSAGSKASHRDAWDGHICEQPPPIPEPRPSIDGVFAGDGPVKVVNDTLKGGLDSRRSNERTKSVGSRKSAECESRRSRQELLFPQPPTSLNIQHEFLDQAARDSLRRTSEASRTLTPADFRLSVDSEASIYSRLSVIEQEISPNSELSSSPPPASPPLGKVGKSDPPSKFLRPAPLQLNHRHSPLLHTTWASPISSPLDQTFAASPTSLLMPNALMSLQSTASSALIQSVEMDKKSDEYPKEHHNNGEITQVVKKEIVVDDEEPIPARVVQETTLDTEYSRVTILDTSADTIALPERALVAAREDLNTRTPSPMSPTTILEKRDLFNTLDSPMSPMVPSSPPDIQVQGVTDVEPPPVSPMSQSALSTLSHLRPVRPTLAELREGGGAPIPGTNQRRSLFLPHPNAPKAPSTSTPGPMFIATQQPAPHASQSTLSGSPKRTLLDVIHMALHSPAPAALRPRMMSRGPTIYGQLDVDLNAAAGPVPITFSVEPPPKQSQPLLFHQRGPQFMSPPFASPTPSPLSPIFAPLPRSATSSPLLLNMPDGDRTSENNLAETSNTETTTNGTSGGVIPRAKFFPKASGARPRSRSFSALSSHSTRLEISLPLSSREEGSQFTATRTTSDVQHSPIALRSSDISSLSQAQSIPGESPVKTLPLRPSPPVTGLHRGLTVVNPTPKSPSSPLAQSFLPTSVSDPPPPSPLATNSSVFGLQIPQQVRQITSRSTLNDAMLSRPSFSSTTPLEPPPSPASSKIPRETNMQPINHAPPARDQAPANQETDTTSSHSHSDNLGHFPSPPIQRQPSLRTKLSLPNLRRNRSKTDDNPSPGSPVVERDPSSTVQVQHLDFELVRPTIQFQQARSSEDSGTPGRHVSMDLQHSRETLLQRVDSPAGSLGNPKSPTGDGFGVRARPSLSASATPLVMRAALDTEINMDAHRHRESKWMSLMGSIAPSQWRKSKKVKKLIQEGVPSSVRYLVWSHLTDGKAKVVPGVYFQLGNRDRIPAADAIEEDIKTCFQEQTHLQGKRGPVLALLQAYLTMVPDVRYTMGLTLIAGQLLLHAPEEDAFWIFVSIMDTHIRPYFSINPTQMEVDSALFSRVVEGNDLQLAKKLYIDMGIEPSSICIPWFSTLFVGTLPVEYVNRVWDSFLYEGIPFLLRVGFAVMTCCRRQILGANSPDVIFGYLRHPPRAWLPPTPDGFLALVQSVRMKDDDVRKNRVKMEAQVKRQTQAQSRHLPITASISLPRP